MPIAFSVPSSLAVSNALTIASLSGLLKATGGLVQVAVAGVDYATGAGGGGGSGDVTSSMLAATGQQAWSAANNNGINLSGQLTATGAALRAQLTGLSGQAVSTYATISNLALTGQQTFALITGLSGQAVSTYATITNLALTGSALRVQLTGLSGQAVSTYATITNLASTGQQLVATNLVTSGALASGLSATGNTLWQRDLSISGALQALISASAAGVGTINGLSGSLTLSTAGTGIGISTSGQTIYISGNGLSALSVTGGPILARPNLVGLGGVQVFSSGGNVYVSGVTGGGGAGDVTYAQMLGASGAITAKMSAPYAYATGGLVTYTVDPSKATQALRITATGNVILQLAGTYDGCNGLVIVEKLFAGTGSLTFPASGQVVNASGILSIPLPTDSGGYHAATFSFEQNRSYWVASTLSGSTASTQVLTGNYSAVSVTGSSTIFAPDFSGIGGALVLRLGNAIVISGANAGSSALGGVTGVNSVTGGVSVIGAGNVAVSTAGQTITVSGLSSQSTLSPPFTYATGGLVTLTADNTKSTQDVLIQATGNVILQINGAYDGCNGTVAIYKLFNGTGSLTLPGSGYIVNGLGGTVMQFQTGQSGYDVASFRYTNVNSLWAVSTLSGAISTAGGGASSITVTGSSALSSPDFTGLGGVIVRRVGTNTVQVSGGLGDVTSAQLVATSGILSTPPQTDLAGGTVLWINSLYYDTFTGLGRTLVFSGTPANSSFITLRADVTAYTEIGIPASYRIGQPGVVNSLPLTPANHEISWIYSASKWWLNDSVGGFNNYGASGAPKAIDGQISGYVVGSEWINTGVGHGTVFKCLEASSGVNAVWRQMQQSILSAVRVTGNFNVSGNATYGYVWSGSAGQTWTGTMAAPSSLSGHSILLKNVSTGANLFLTGSIDYALNRTITPFQALKLWSDSQSWLIV